MKKIFIQILRFGFVGATAFLIDFGILYLLTEIIGANYLLANCFSFTVSVIYNYLMSVVWVFETDKTKNKVIELFIFILLSIIGLGTNQLIMWILVDKIHVNYLISKIFVTGIVMVYNFITRKLFLENITTNERRK